MQQNVLHLFDDEKVDLREEIENIISDPDQWMAMPNDQLGGRRPMDMKDPKDEQTLRDLLRAIKHGMIS